MAEQKQSGSQPRQEPADLPRFSHEQLIESGPRALGVAPFVVAGALAREKKKELTMDEAKRAVKRFLGR